MMVETSRFRTGLVAYYRHAEYGQFSDKLDP